jgi:hypothetical protein
MKEGVTTLISILAILLLLLIVFGFLMTNKSPETPRINYPEAEISHDHHLYNHSVGHEMMIDPLTDKKSIQPTSVSGIPRSIKAGTEIKVYIRKLGMPNEEKADWIPYTTLDVMKDINDLHIGMVTMKYDMGAQPNQHAQTGLVQGMTFVRIHNLTDQVLCLNYNITVNPHEHIYYRGENAQGVGLGLLLKDNNHFYPDVMLEMPATDIYYGVSSEIEQPMHGGIIYKGDVSWNHIWDEPDWASIEWIKMGYLQ